MRGWWIAFVLSESRGTRLHCILPVIDPTCTCSGCGYDVSRSPCWCTQYCGDWESVFHIITVHERRQLLWHVLHITCVYVANMQFCYLRARRQAATLAWLAYYDLHECMLQTSISLLAFVHSDVKNAFSRSPQYIWFSVHKHGDRNTCVSGKLTRWYVRSCKCITVWVCLVKIFIISKFIVHQQWKHLALCAIQTSYSHSESWHKLNTQH